MIKTINFISKHKAVLGKLMRFLPPQYLPGLYWVLAVARMAAMLWWDKVPDRYRQRPVVKWFEEYCLQLNPLTTAEAFIYLSSILQFFWEGSISLAIILLMTFVFDWYYHDVP